MKQKITNKQVLILLGILVVAVFVLNYQPPEFFDNFGVIVFSFLIGLGVWMIRTKKETPDNIAFIVLAIGILGIIIDGFIVLN